jgi:hypothetical protein
MSYAQTADSADGYLHPLYAQSFSETGTPIFLPKSKGWLIQRQILNTPYFDAMGPYPLFFCKDWDLLIEDLETLKEQIVSVSLVISPFSVFPRVNFKWYFDQFHAYKTHYILDLSLPLISSISKNKRRNAIRALRDISVDLVKSPNIDLNEWFDLYQNLIKRHHIQGIRAFSRDSFEKQIAIPNTHFFRALHENAVVGGNLFYIQGDVAYAHLSAFTGVGYEKGAPYAIKWVALGHLSDVVRWVNFGGSPDVEKGKKSGLEQFKKGWSNRSDNSYFCGKILNYDLYDQLVRTSNTNPMGFFPAYRKGKHLD